MPPPWLIAQRMPIPISSARCTTPSCRWSSSGPATRRVDVDTGNVEQTFTRFLEALDSAPVNPLAFRPDPLQSGPDVRHGPRSRYKPLVGCEPDRTGAGVSEERAFRASDDMTGQMFWSVSQMVCSMPERRW